MADATPDDLMRQTIEGVIRAKRLDSATMVQVFAAGEDMLAAARCN